jgi:uncharacterized protein YbdZ (MbtH family)
MPNPFEDDNASYLVVVNDDGQYSLWPERIAVPAGWRVALESASRGDCLAYVEETWLDMRPLSLVRRSEGRGSSERS